MPAKLPTLVTVLLFLCSDLVFAQAGPARHGVWLDGALGVGWAHFSSDTVSLKSQSGVDGIIALGGTLGPHIRAGVGWGQWSSEWGTGKQNWITSYDILVYYYPVADRSFFVEAAVGSVGFSAVHVPSGGQRADSVYLSGSAWGPTIGVGWDAPLGKLFSLRPRLSYSYGPPRTLRSDDGALTATGWQMHLLSLDLGIVMHAPDSR